MKKTKAQKINRRHLRVRRTVVGSTERPRLYVRKSNKHIYVQLLDDSDDKGSKTLYSSSTVSKETADKHMANAAQAAILGRRVGEELKAKGILKIVYDRGGYRYHGTVKALADGIREAGIDF